MFDFENLDVYHKARKLRTKVFALLSEKQKIDKSLLDQLKRAIVSVILNIAEGTGKSSKADKRNFFMIARGSIYEVVSIFDILLDDGIITQKEKDSLYSDFETVSKMLLGLINSLR